MYLTISFVAFTISEESIGQDDGVLDDAQHGSMLLEARGPRRMRPLPRSCVADRESPVLEPEASWGVRT